MAMRRKPESIPIQSFVVSCKRYSRIPDLIESNTKLTPASKLVYGAMLSYQGKRQYCFASYEKIANRTGVNYYTVGRAVAQLISYRCIEPIRDPATLAQFQMKGGYKGGKTKVFRCLYIPEQKVKPIRKVAG